MKFESNQHKYKAASTGHPRQPVAPVAPIAPSHHGVQNAATRPIMAIQNERPTPSGTSSNATRVVPPASSPPPRRPKKPKKKPRAGKTALVVISNLFKAFVILMCIGLISLAIVGVQVTSYVVETTADDDVVLDLELLQLPQTGYILAKDPDTGDWIEYQQLSRESNSVWVPLEQIPSDLVNAVVATEDREFYEHQGVSFERTVYAALNEVFQFQSTFGGSTIDQQLVKNITDDRAVDGEAGYQRKIREIFRAFGLNTRYSKDMIMEAYLNTLPLSGTIVGVQAGAKEYFDKDVSELTLAECAVIAGITRAPTYYSPIQNPDNALERRNDVLYFMLETGSITQAEFDEATAQPLGLNQGQLEEALSAEQEVTSYFTDAVFESVVTDLVDQGICASREEAIDFYYTEGLHIESTVDLRLQDEMERLYELEIGEEGSPFPTAVSATDEAGNTIYPQSAMAVVRYDGSLAGVVGGIGEKEESLGLNRATQSVRQVGSTMKPIGAYALGIDLGVVSYATRVPDTYVIPSQNWPVNYGPSAPSNQTVPVYSAVAQSLNTIPAHIGEWVGVQTLYDFLEGTLEISTLVPEGNVNDVALSPLVLGGMTNGMIPAELAAAYTMFGGEDTYGVHNTLHCYERVTDSRGNIVMEPEITSMQAISPASGYIMNRLLSGVLTQPGATAYGMTLQTSDAVAKTGTTSDDKDRWFVGLTPNYVSVVWWGYDQNEIINWSPAASTNPPPIVWREVMDNVQAEMPESSFPEMPAGVVERAYCVDTGLLAGDACANRGVGYYLENSLPAVCLGNHPAPAA